MFDLGLAIIAEAFRRVLARSGRLLKGLFAVLIAVPALHWLLPKTLISVEQPKSASS